jgi:hypothetical protein
LYEWLELNIYLAGWRAKMPNKSRYDGWFSRVLPESISDAKCPRCGAPFDVNAIFDHHPRSCVGCGTVLVEWNLNRHVYILDKERAPALVRSIMDLTGPMDEHRAGVELDVVEELFYPIDEKYNLWHLIRGLLRR